MATSLLQCPNCHAPLPPPAAGFSVCPYCRSTVAVGGAAGVTPAPAPAPAAAAAAAAAAPARAAPERSFEERTKTATDTFLRVIAQRGTTDQAAWYAAHDYGAKDFDPRDVWSGAVALARDFDAKNKTKVVSDATAMVRLFEGYVKLISGIRVTGQSEISMPFFAVTTNGPVHLQGTYDATSIYELIKRCGPKQS